MTSVLKYLLGLIIAVNFLSCAVSESKKEQSPFSFTMSQFKKTSPDCNISDSTFCASYEVNYPVFTGLTDSSRVKVEKAINANVSMGNPEAEGWTMQMVADNFINNFESFKKDTSALSSSWYYKADIAVETLVDTLLSLSIKDEFFTGGAHGGGGKYFISINPVTADPVTLKTILKGGYDEALRAEGEKAFRQNHHLLDTASLIENGFEFPENKFQLNDNYGFTRDGIVFVFNSYEIASYAEGPTEILIPYERIRDWLKTNP
jgi:hypothetical protein